MIHLTVNRALYFQPMMWLQSFLLKLFGHSQGNLLVNDYFIARAQDELFLTSCDDCYQAKSEDYVSATDSLLIKNKLVFGQLVHKKSKGKIDVAYFSDIHNRAKKLIIQLEAKEIEQAISAIYSHLKKRESERKIIVEHGAVQEIFGQLIEYSSMLEILLKYLEDQGGPVDCRFMDYSKKLIRTACIDLAKLQGGHGFLYGGVTEMLWFFQLINSIYLV